MNWINILAVAFVGACLLGICGFTVDFLRNVPSWERRKDRKHLARFKQAVEKEMPPDTTIKTRIDIDWFPSIWKLIYPMKQGSWRNKWKNDLLLEITHSYGLMAKGHMAGYLNSAIYQETEKLRYWVKVVDCPVCNTTMHIVYQAFYGGFENPDDRIFPVNEDERIVISEDWMSKDRKRFRHFDAVMIFKLFQRQYSANVKLLFQ